MLSQLAVFKDVIPGYRIRALTDKEKAEKEVGDEEEEDKVEAEEEKDGKEVGDEEEEGGFRVDR